jgi:hyperosmotically inducible protein
MQAIHRSLILSILMIVCFVNAANAQQATPSSQAPQTGEAQVNNTSPGDDANNSLSPEAQDKLVREVRHELIMLPYYNVFDNLSFGIEGRTVILRGQVTKPVLKSDAENVVKRIEGVDKVVNNIEVLPPSPMDDRIRRQVYASIYGYGPLFKYGNMSVPPIHIIVKNGRITLEGVVDSENDKNLAGMRANQVPGTFQVTNNLRVVNSSNNAGDSKKKK